MSFYPSSHPDLEQLEGCIQTFYICSDEIGHRFRYSYNYFPMSAQLLELGEIDHNQIDNHDASHLNYAMMNRKNHLTTRRGQNDLRC